LIDCSAHLLLGQGRLIPLHKVRYNPAEIHQSPRVNFRLTIGHAASSCRNIREWVLRPLQPLDLKEHEQVLVSVVKTALGRSSLAVDYIENVKRGLQDAEPVPGLEEVRRRLAKIDGSMAAEIVADREERLAGHFFDSSALVNLYHPEAGTPAVDQIVNATDNLV
jgi:hypothetical protein